MTKQHETAEPAVTPWPAAMVAAVAFRSGSNAARPALEAVRAHATAGPDRVAVESESGTLSYGALWAAAETIADGLREAGVCDGGLVGIALSRRPHLLAALLGVWLSGAGYVPLDPRMPPVRRGRIMDELQEHGMRCLITDSAATANTLAALPLAQLKMAELPDPFVICTVGDRAAASSVKERLGDVAYVMYTSGSTGNPKGTIVSHRNVAAFTAATEAALGPGPSSDELTIATAPLTFDTSVLELIWPLTAGRRLLLLDAISEVKPATLQAVLRRPGPKLLQVTPSTSSLIVFPDKTDQLRIFVGGEALHRRTATSLLPHCTSLVNLYGPTETTVWVSYHTVPDPPGEAAVVSLGRALPGCVLAVLGPDGDETDDDEPGELCVAGPQVAVGYLGRASSATAFAEGGSAGGRFYRTGDRVSRAADGSLSYIGRFDDQIKIAGNRVELGEIESALAEHPAVAHAAAIAIDGPAGKLIAAFIELGTGFEPTALPPSASGESLQPPADLLGSISAHLSARLPRHMVPAAIRVVGKLPLNSNGKVDRPRLAFEQPTGIGLLPSRTVSASATRLNPWPRPTAERQRIDDVPVELLRLVTDASGIALGPDDDLVAMGLDSVSAIRIAAEALRVYGWDTTGGHLLRSRTLREAFRDRRNTPALVSASPSSGGEPPLSLAQRAMLAVSYLQPHSTKTTAIMRWTLRGKVDTDRLRTAIDSVSARHPVLRTLFPAGADPLVADHRPGALQMLPTERDQVDETSLDSVAKRPFDLSQEFPVRWLLIIDDHELGDPGTATLCAVFHHVAVDDAALVTLHGELTDAYAGVDARAAGVPRYDSAFSAEQALFRHRSKNDRAYWRARKDDLAGAVRFKPTPNSEATVRRHSINVENGARILTGLAQQHRVTAYSLFLAISATSVGTVLTGSSVLAGVPVSSREAVRGHALLGCFANLVPLPIALHPFDLHQTIKDTHASVLDALDHGLLPYAEIARLTRMPNEPGWGTSPSFVCQLADKPARVRCRDLSFAPDFGEPVSAFYAVTLRGELAGEDLEVHVDHVPSALPAAKAEELATEVAGMLLDLCGQAEHPLPTADSADE